MPDRYLMAMTTTDDHEDAQRLARDLVDSGRWLDESARPLLADVLACGPLQPVG